MHRPTVRRRATGSTLVEIGIAMLLFLIVAGTVTTGATRAIGRDAESQLQLLAGDALEGLLARVAAGGYASAVGAATDPRLPGCPDGAGVCVDVGPHTGRHVTFDIEVLRDTRLAATSTSVSVTATVTLPGGQPINRTTTVLAPAGGFAPGDRGVVRVTFSDPHPTQTYLLDADTQAVVGSASTVDGVAIVSTKPAACTRLDPCRVALSAQAPYFSSGGIGLDQSSATLPVTATDGAVTDVAATTLTTGAGTLALTATNPDGTSTGPPTEPGSVCLWAQLPGGADAPLCNTGDPATVTLDSYPMPDRDDLRLPLPAGVALPVTTDRADGSCPPVAGGRGHRVDGWADLAVCTSWTWGHPDTWQAGSDPAVAFTQAAVTLTADGAGAAYTAGWTHTTAQPATGLGSQPVWAKPREAPGCATDASCTPLPAATHLEADECPGEHCFSVATLSPRVTAPRLGTHQVTTVAMADTAGKKTFSLDFDDPDGDTVTVTLTEAAAPSGVLRRGTGGAAIAAGEVVTTFTGSGTVELEFDKSGGGAQLNRFTLTLDDGTTTVTQQVGVFQSPYAWKVVTDDALTAAQGTSGHVVTYTLVGTDGEALGGTAVDVEIVRVADGTQLSATTVTTDTSGTASVTVDLTSNPAAGDYEVRALPGDTAINGDGVAAVVPLTVLPTAGNLTVAATDAAQGESSAVTATATDLAGDPMAGAVVRLSLPDAPAGAALDSLRCVTDDTGACTASILTDAGTPSGTYTLQADSGAFTVTDPYTITAVVGAVTADPAAVMAGGTAALDVHVSDQAAQPAAGVEVAATSSNADVTVDTSATTAADGTATLQLSAASTATPGTVTVTLTAGTVTHRATVTVTTTPASVAATPDPLQLARGATGTLSVTVTDDQGRPVADVRVTAAVDGDGLTVDRSATTGTDGTAVFDVAAAARSGSGTMTLTADPASSTITYTVGG